MFVIRIQIKINREILYCKALFWIVLLGLTVFDFRTKVLPNLLIKSSIDDPELNCVPINPRKQLMFIHQLKPKDLLYLYIIIKKKHLFRVICNHQYSIPVYHTGNIPALKHSLKGGQELYHQLFLFIVVEPIRKYMLVNKYENYILL